MKSKTRLSHILSIFIIGCIKYTIQLTASQVSNFCHCDLTPSYCDFGCCCDTDCSTTISSQCFNAKSSIFCINSSYYFKIDPSLTPSTSNTGCYYYNQTTYLQQQVTISTKQVNAIAARNTPQIALASTEPQLNRGFQIGDLIQISGLSSFSFINSLNGNCIATGANSSAQSSIKWRQNYDITCSSSTNAINLFDNVLGRSVYAFSSTTSQSVLIPKPDSTNFNEVIIYIFIGRYGSNNVQYIQSIKTEAITTSSTTKTLRIRFVNPLTDLKQEQSWPSFFPQIPYDIFYPIYQIAYSFS